MEASFWGLWSRNPSSPSSPTSQDEDNPKPHNTHCHLSEIHLPVAQDQTGGRERAEGGARSGSPVLTPAGPTPPISPATSEGSNPDSLSHSQASISRVEAEPLFRTCTHRTRSVFVPIHGRSRPRQAWELGPSGQAGLGEGPATLSPAPRLSVAPRNGAAGTPTCCHPLSWSLPTGRRQSPRLPPSCGSQRGPQAPPQLQNRGEGGLRAPSSSSSSGSPRLGHGMAERAAPRICIGHECRLEADGDSGRDPIPTPPSRSAVSHEYVLQVRGGARADRFRLKGGARRPESLT